MPQSPLAADVALTPANAFAPLRVEANSNLRSCNGSISSALNITAATVVKATPGRAVMISVIVAGSGAGAVYDHATTSGVGAANEIFIVPDTAGAYLIDWPCLVGIVVAPGTGQTLAISYV
jgi:N-acetylglucosamine kinase-like BadF-type ATPase